MLNFSSIFSTWHTKFQEGLLFGGLPPEAVRGRNGFLYCDEADRAVDLLTVLANSLENTPSRFVCLVPKDTPFQRGQLVLADFEIGSPILELFRGGVVNLSSKMTLILLANKESMVVDPIDWELFRERVSLWANGWRGGGVSFPDESDAMFRERVPLNHKPRSATNPEIFRQLSSPSLYSFWNAHASHDSIKARSISSLPPEIATLIDRTNKHPKFLSILGIIPNELRTLVKSACVSHEEALTDISRTLFFAGYRIWKLRQKLSFQFWKEIAPENRKIRKRKKSHRGNPNEQTNCKNLFHFLERHLNLSKKYPTRCPCRDPVLVSKNNNSGDIRTFFHTFPQILPQQQFGFKIPSQVSRHSLFLSQDDFFRLDHDRSKIRSSRLK